MRMKKAHVPLRKMLKIVVDVFTDTHWVLIFVLDTLFGDDMQMPSFQNMWIEHLLQVVIT